MRIYALTSQTMMPVSGVRYFVNEKDAQDALATLRKEIIARNVHITTDEPNAFGFYFGWEEQSVTWRISALEVEE